MPTSPSSADASDRTLDWKPTGSQAIALQVAGVLVSVAGFAGYGLLAAIRYGAGAEFSVDAPALLLGTLYTVAVLAILILLHEGIHGLAMLAFGIRPTFGVGVAGGVLPYAYATAVGVCFERRTYLVVAFAPTVVVNLLGAAVVWWGPWGGWLAFAAALHLGGCVGDWALAGVALRQPLGSRFEDLKDGIRVHLP